MNRLITLTLAIVATATVAARPSAAQESYPNKQITMITPEVVGSAADVLSRVIARLLADAYGQPVTIENIYLEAGVEKAALIFLVSSPLWRACGRMVVGGIL